MSEREDLVRLHLERRESVQPVNYRMVQIIRHGATILNSDDATRDRLRGWMDLPLSAEGIAEARDLAAKLTTDPPDMLFSSDLIRAVQTAQFLGIELKASYHGFKPWNIGELAGRPAIEAVSILAHYATKVPMQEVPGGESFDMFRHRFLMCLLKVLTNHEGIIGIVTHHRCERLLKAWAKGGYRLDGSIDSDEFTHKGNGTAHREIMSIPMHRLYSAACYPEVPEDLEAWRQWQNQLRA